MPRQTLAVMPAVLALALLTGGGATAAPQASTQVNKPPQTEASTGKATPAGAKAAAGTAKNASGFDIDKYFSEMVDDVSVFDPASPWVYEGKAAWRRRVDQMMKTREFLDLNQFYKTEVELGDMKIVTVYRELRRVEGSMTSRLHGRITWVYLKQADGRWFLWHDHTSEVPEEYTYQR
jgi:ketosteroid isomerase-like protein